MPPLAMQIDSIQQKSSRIDGKQICVIDKRKFFNQELLSKQLKKLDCNN